MFTTLKEAYFRTQFKIAQQIYQMIWVNNAFAEYVKFFPMAGQEQAIWQRRKTGDAITGSWILPGSAISPGAHPKVVTVTSALRRLIHQMQLPSQIVNQVDSLYRDPWMVELENAIYDIGRQIWATAITGQFIDTTTVQAGGSITAAMTGTITSNPYNDGITHGQGSLMFTLGDSKFYFRSPNDNDFGDGVVGVVGTEMTLRSKHTAGAITFTPAALPAADADCRLAFSSTNLQPDGLDALMDPSQSSDGAAAGDDFDFEILDRLRFRLAQPYQSDRLTAYVMHTTTLTKALALSRSLGGATMEHQPLQPMGTDQTMIPKVWHYSGHPILACDHIPAATRGVNSTHPIYCVSLNPSLRDGDAAGGSNMSFPIGGFGGVVSGYTEGQVIQMDGRGANGMGFGIEDVGLLEGSDNRAKRLCWNGTWILGSAKAASRHRFIKD